MATGRFNKIIFGDGLDGTDNGDDSITVDADASPADALTMKGDLLTQDPNGTYVRLPIGNTDEVLTVASGLPDWLARIKTLCKFGGTPLTGAVTLSEGSNVNITQSGQDIEIAATVVGSGAVDSIAVQGDTTMVGNIEFAAGVGIALSQDDADTLTIAQDAGGSVLLYDYTVAGSDKASIDTGVDTPNAGIAGTSAFSGAYRVLEVWIYARTDEAVAASTLSMTLNNDGTSIYDNQRITGANTTASAAAGVAGAGWQNAVAGASAAANVFGSFKCSIHNYAGTVGYKVADLYSGVADTTAANSNFSTRMMSYRSTAAITRIAITPATGTKKLKVGSRITIYAR